MKYATKRNAIINRKENGERKRSPALMAFWIAVMLLFVCGFTAAASAEGDVVTPTDLQPVTMMRMMRSAPPADPTPEEPPVAGAAAIIEQNGNAVANPTQILNDSASKSNPQNAIQKAVDSAIQSIRNNSQISDITIQVEAGEYNGDISIAKPSGLNRTVRLNIIANGADKDADGNYLPTANGTAKANGNINIDGINVLLAGIYLALDKTITAKNADLTVVGTTLDDTLKIETKNGSGKIDVNTGEGKDTVGITIKTGTSGDVGPVTVDTGAGNDTVTILADKDHPTGDVSVDTGAGDDTVDVNVAKGQTKDGKADTDVSIDTGDGNDVVTLTTGANIQSVEVDVDSGNDTATITTAAVAKDITVNADDTAIQAELPEGQEVTPDTNTLTVTTSGEIGGNITVETEDANDVVTVTTGNTGNVKGKIDIETDEGNDSVTLVTGYNAEISGDISIKTGKGKDSVTLKLGKTPAKNPVIKTGAGDDTVTIAKNGATGGTYTGDREVAVETGTCDDTIHVDITAADVIGTVRITDSAEAGGKDNYHVHFLGILDPKAAAADKITASADLKTITMTNSSKNKLKVVTSSVEGRRLSDDLTNKPMVQIDLGNAANDAKLTVNGSGSNKTAIYTADGLFTDYMIVNTKTKDFASIEEYETFLTENVILHFSDTEGNKEEYL